MSTELQTSLEYVIENAQHALSRVTKKDVKQTIDKLLKAEKIFIFGVGRSGLMGKAFAMRLMHLGLSTYVIGETIAPAIGKNDAVILISGSGETKSVIKIARLAKEIGASIIAIVSKKESTLVSLSDVRIILSFKTDKTEQSHYAPLGTLFEDSALLLLDALVVDVMIHTEETEDSMSARHATLE